MSVAYCFFLFGLEHILAWNNLVPFFLTWKLFRAVAFQHNIEIEFFKGKSDTFCEVYLGSQEHRTKVVPKSLNPKWNASMQFLVKDLQQDVLCVTVLDRDYFSPNGKFPIQIFYHSKIPKNTQSFSRLQLDRISGTNRDPHCWCAAGFKNIPRSAHQAATFTRGGIRRNRP